MSKKNKPHEDERPVNDATHDAANLSGGETSISDIWLLEDLYPDVGGLLSSSRKLSAEDQNVLVALDTNALMLPFNISKQELGGIEAAYQKLIDQQRIFVPARVIREYIKNRDTKLAEIIASINTNKSLVDRGIIEYQSLIEGLPETTLVLQASEELNDSRRKYFDALSKLVAVMQAWRGDDPVSSIYNKIFKSDIIVETPGDRPQIENDWKWRRLNRVAPGHKDGGKQDTGIGDYLIWGALLELGKVHSKDLIFVTGETKGDWFVRGGGEPIYPRPELVDEYRRASGGKTIQLSTLATLLSQLKAPDEVVREVRNAEFAANTAFQAARRRSTSATSSVIILSADKTFTTGEAIFDYSTNDGRVSLGNEDVAVELRFSKASDDAIHLYRDGDTRLIARVKDVTPGEQIRFEAFDNTSRSYTISLGETFLARNAGGFTLVGRITKISDDSRGALSDSVVFKYRIFAPDEPLLVP